MEEKKQYLDISWGAIIKILFALTVIYLLYQVVEILIWSIFALVISILFNPAVNFLRKLRIPRVIGTILVYFSFFGLISLFLYAIIPSLHTEIKSFSVLLPEYIERVSPLLVNLGVEGFSTLDEIVEILRHSSDEVTRGVFNAITLIFGGLSTAFFIIVMAIFLSLEGNSIEKAISVLVSEKQKKQAINIWKNCRNQVGRWFLIRVVVSIFVAISSFFVFYLFGVKYALIFAIVAGVFNLVPFAGPAVAGLLFFLITALDSVPQAVFVFVAFMIIQIIDGSILTPVLSKKIMGVSPALVLIAIVIGGTLWGILGAFLAIPLLGIIFEFTKTFMEKRAQNKI